MTDEFNIIREEVKARSNHDLMNRLVQATRDVDLRHFVVTVSYINAKGDQRIQTEGWCISDACHKTDSEFVLEAFAWRQQLANGNLALIGFYVTSKETCREIQTNADARRILLDREDTGIKRALRKLGFNL